MNDEFLQIVNQMPLALCVVLCGWYRFERDKKNIHQHIKIDALIGDWSFTLKAKRRGKKERQK